MSPLGVKGTAARRGRSADVKASCCDCPLVFPRDPLVNTKLHHRIVIILRPLDSASRVLVTYRERRQQDQTKMKKHSEGDYRLSGHRSYGSVIPEFCQVIDRNGMKRDLRDVADRLNSENPAVVAPQTASGRLPETYVKVKVFVVSGQGFIPAAIGLEPSTHQYRAVEIDFHHANPSAPDVKIPIPSSLYHQENHHQQSHEREWYRRALIAPESDR